VLNAVAPVEVERLTHDAIRTGAWKQDSRALASAPPPAARVTTLPAPQAQAPVVPPSVSPPEVPAGTVSTAVIAPPAEPAASVDDAVPEPPRSTRPIALAAPGFWLQLGAFRERDGAFDFQRKVEREVDWLAPLMAVFTDRDLHRLQAGPYASRSDANGAAERLRAELQLVPLVIERR
jgi:rare lipoprotein A